MSGDTLAWKGPAPRHSDSADSNPDTQFNGEIKILKVCFCTNNNLGKNFKLVKCDSSWQIRVREPFSKYEKGRVDVEVISPFREKQCFLTGNYTVNLEQWPIGTEH